MDRKTLLEIWRRAFTGDDSSDPLEVAVDELSSYFKISRDEAISRCKNWETDSLQEWKQEDRSSPEGLAEFYKTQTSWIFDTMWYHAEQCAESKPAESVDITEGFYERIGDWKIGHHLDFGAGPGTTSLFFHKLGAQTSLADISTSFLDFAKWRLERHGVPATFYDSSVDKLPDAEFDLITALDVMAHVPDIDETLSMLNRSLKPGGYLVFNIDNRPCSELTQWHLYAEQFPILRQVRSAGFRRLPKIKYFHVYQKVDRSPAKSLLINLVDHARYNSAVTAAGNLARSIRHR